MSDALRAQKLKLANSRKRFKELQELKKKKDASQHANETSELSRSNDSPNISLVNSTHSSLSNEPHGENLVVDDHNVAQIPNYFNTTNYETNYQQPAVFFDECSQIGINENVQNSSNGSSNMFSYFNQPSNQTVMDNIVSNIVDTSKAKQGNYEQNYNENYSLFSVNNQHSYVQETQNIIHPNHDVLSLDDPEIKQNELYDLHHQESKCLPSKQNEAKLHEDALSIDDPEIKQESYDHKNNVPDPLPFDTQLSSSDNIRIIENVNSTKNDIYVKGEIESSTIFKIENQHSQLENTHLDMAQVIDPKYTSASPITDLEKRNIELMSLFEQEKLKCEQQKLLIDNLESTVAQIGHEKKEFEETNNQKLYDKIGSLEEELQCHVQTVTMLVGEKSELSVMVNQLEFLLKQKSAECEELQARLKASRSRVAELEREMNHFKSEKHKYENAGQESNELLTKAKQSFDILKEEKEELLQDLLETREKLRTISDEHSKFEQLNRDLSSKLSLANVKIQQISNGEHGDIQVEKLNQEKHELEKQLSNLNSTLNTISKEHNDSNVQYQQYTQQLSAQLTSLSNRIEQLQVENETLSIQEQSRVKHIGELERQLQMLQKEQVAYTSNQFGTDTNLKEELERIKELLVQLQMEKTVSDENYTKACNERDMLTRELQAKNESLSELESEVERLRGNQPDSAKLLATMESDKVAAAAAVRQNIDLKEQVKGMQEVIAKMDSDKVDLTEKLSLEQSSNKDLLDKLKKTELHLQRLTDAIEIKDRELSHLRTSSEEVTRQIMQKEHLTDRLRHYEAQDNSSHVIQNELQETKQMLVKVTNELNELKNGNSQKMQPNPKEILEDTVKILENLDLENKELNSNPSEIINLSSINVNSNDIKTSNITYDDKDNVLDKEEAMRHLEEKFKRTMQDIADLTEEKQRLEHLVLQLQGETETIGEYVALYQQQRMILKQRALENDQQLKQLADDREQMKEKLEKLNELIRKLVTEKGSIPKELLRQHENLTEHSDNFCEAHTKMHEQINKLNDKVPVEMDATKNTETAEEIIALLSEIKNSNLVEPNENFHHCPWCSGQLITV